VKKITLSISLTLLLAVSISLKSQTSAINTTTTGLCINTTVEAWVQFPPPSATSYSWIVFFPSCQTTPAIQGNGQLVSLTYSCCGINTLICNAYNGSTLLATITKTVNVSCNTAPNISITGVSTLCTSGSTSLTATGAVSYTWSNLQIFSSIIVSPTVSTCYSVQGMNMFGCINNTAHCLTIIPLTLTVSGTQTVCLGSSTTFSVSGASNYTWFPNMITTTQFSVLPTSTIPIMAAVLGMDANGCSGSSFYNVTAFDNCAIVWPGDANRDGMVDNTDVFELGLAANSTGPARTATSNAWSGQFANAWTGSISTGWNKCHADCNGDGVVNTTDNLAITANFSLTHSFKSAASANPDIKIVSTNSFVNTGLWNKVDVVLGDATNTLNQLYGVAFELNYEQAMIQTDSVKVVYTSSFLNASNQAIDFQKPYFNNGKTYCATVRTNQTNVNGNGKIAELWFKVKTGLGNNIAFHLSASNGKTINANGNLGTLDDGSQIALTVNNNPTGIANSIALNTTIRFYPNPASNKLILENDLNTTTSFQLFDISGRLMLAGEFVGSTSLNLSSLKEGVYLMEFESLNGKVSKKLVINREN
jgi:hypothetical protein